MTLDIPNFLPLINYRKYNIPIEANFAVTIENLFESYSGIIDKLGRVEEIISPSNHTVGVLDSGYWWELPDSLTKAGIFFANSVTVPGESSSTARVGMAQVNNLFGGLLSAPILKGRADAANLDISFIETNMSFVDSVMRPWSIAISQFGLFAREPTSWQNFKTNVSINYLNKRAYSDEDYSIRKRITFFDAAPVSVEGYTSKYGATGANVQTRTSKTSWVYSTYAIEYPAFVE